VNFRPSGFVRDPVEGVLLQQKVSTVGVGVVADAVIERSQTLDVLVVR